MTKTNAETVEAVAKLLDDDKALLPDKLSPAEAYAWATFKVRACALALRLAEPAKPTRRRKEAA